MDRKKYFYMYGGILVVSLLLIYPYYTRGVFALASEFKWANWVAAGILFLVAIPIRIVRWRWILHFFEVDVPKSIEKQYLNIFKTGLLEPCKISVVRSAFNKNGEKKEYVIFGLYERIMDLLLMGFIAFFLAKYWAFGISCLVGVGIFLFSKQLINIKIFFVSVLIAGLVTTSGYLALTSVVLPDAPGTLLVLLFLGIFANFVPYVVLGIGVRELIYLSKFNSLPFKPDDLMAVSLVVLAFTLMNYFLTTGITNTVVGRNE